MKVLTPRLAQQVEHGHPVIGHRDLLFVVGLLSQRREDDAMADSFVGSLCCYTNSRDTTQRRSRVSAAERRWAGNGRVVGPVQVIMPSRVIAYGSWPSCPREFTVNDRRVEPPDLVEQPVADILGHAVTKRCVPDPSRLQPRSDRGERQPSGRPRSPAGHCGRGPRGRSRLGAARP
jgi:hypothetical protein